MPRREYVIWSSLLIIIVSLAIVFILFPPIQELSPYAGDIIGSMIGFLLAISAAEIIKLDEKRDRAKKINEDIRGDRDRLQRVTYTNQLLYTFINK